MASDFRKKIICTTAVLHNICTLCIELKDFYFEGTDSRRGFPHIFVSLNKKMIPFDKIVCQRCQKTSNGGFVPKDKCLCFSTWLIDRAPLSLLEREPNICNDITSSDPLIRSEAYLCLLFGSVCHQTGNCLLNTRVKSILDS